MKKTLSLIIALLMLLSVFTAVSCTKKPTEPALGDVIIPGITNNPQLNGENVKKGEGLLVYKNNGIPGGIFLFLLSQTKSAYLYSATGSFTDDAELWNEKDKSGVTIGEIIFNETLDSALSILYYATVAQENGIALTESETAEITASLDAMVQGYGSRTAFNNEMLRFGVGYNSLREFYKLEKLAQKGAASVLDEGGSDPITEEELKDYYKNNFVTLRHVYFNTTYADDESGEAPSQEEIDKKSARADKILELVNSGYTTLPSFKNESEDGLIADSPEGITLPLGDLLEFYAGSSEAESNVFYTYYFLFSKVRGFAEAALMHPTGTVTRVDSEVGIFLVERTPLIMNMFSQYKDAINQFVIRPQRMSDTVQKLKGENAFTINQAALDTYNTQSAPVMMMASAP